MSDIRLARAHNLALSRARAIAQQAADSLAERYAVICHWEGDTLRFRRPGAEGSMEVSASQIAVEVRLGLLLKPFRQEILRGIESSLDRHLGGASPPSAAPAVDANQG